MNGPGGTVTGACTASARQQLPSVLTGQVISIVLRACRAVWQYMNDESERRRVDMVLRDHQLIREAGRLLSAEQRAQEQRHPERQQRTDRFIRRG